MRNICFISIFDLTIVYKRLALSLESRRHNIFWMTTNPKWTNWLVEEGTSRSRILELAFGREDFLVGSARSATLDSLAKTETHTSQTVSTAMLADQFVMDRPAEITREFMLLYYDRISAWLKENKIDLVFAEPTNSNELIANMVCETLAIPFVFPQTMRIPSNRFFFSRGVQYSEMVDWDRRETNSDSAAGVPDGREVIRSFQMQPERPKYFHLNNAAGAVDTKRIGRSLPSRLADAFGDSSIHLTHHRTTERVRLTVRRAVNRTRLEHLTSYPTLDSIEGKCAFYGLHVQPEQSIDVVGPFVSDQVKLIKDIRRSLPTDMTLLVKEHPNALGSKPWHEIQEIQRIPGVVLIDHRESTFSLYKRVSLVFTVSGTTAFESALLGTPAITFTRMYFGGLSSVYCCEEITTLKQLITSILKAHKHEPAQDVCAMNAMLARSFVGYWTDPLTDSAVMATENLALLEKAFATVVEHGIL